MVIAERWNPVEIPGNIITLSPENLVLFEVSPGNKLTIIISGLLTRFDKKQSLKNLDFSPPWRHRGPREPRLNSSSPSTSSRTARLKVVASEHFHLLGGSLQCYQKTMEILGFEMMDSLSDHSWWILHIYVILLGDTLGETRVFLWPTFQPKVAIVCLQLLGATWKHVEGSNLITSETFLMI